MLKVAKHALLQDRLGKQIFYMRKSGKDFITDPFPEAPS